MKQTSADKAKAKVAEAVETILCRDRHASNGSTKFRFTDGSTLCVDVRITNPTEE